MVGLWYIIGRWLRNFQLTEANAATFIGETKYRERIILYCTVVLYRVP